MNVLARLLTEKRPTSFQTPHFPIAFSSRTRATTEEHEELLYPWWKKNYLIKSPFLFQRASLVADFGGLLGLFLGFSFMTLWDGVIWVSFENLTCFPIWTCSLFRCAIAGSAWERYAVGAKNWEQIVRSLYNLPHHRVLLGDDRKDNVSCDFWPQSVDQHYHQISV